MSENILADFDENLAKLEDKGVPLDRMVLYGVCL